MRFRQDYVHMVALNLLRRLVSSVVALRCIYLLASLTTCAPLLAACVGISATELQRIGSKITPENINFGELYTYAERASAAYAAKTVIRSKYPQTVRINAPAKLTSGIF